MEMSARVRVPAVDDPNFVPVRADAPPAVKVQARMHSVTPETIKRNVPMAEEETDTSVRRRKQRADPAVERVQGTIGHRIPKDVCQWTDRAVPYGPDAAGGAQGLRIFALPVGKPLLRRCAGLLAEAPRELDSQKAFGEEMREQ
jgi:hypothetical protein